MGGLIYCKNCFDLTFNPSQVSNVIAQRGAMFALESDVNCFYRGEVDVKMQGFAAQGLFSLYDGGGIVYSKSDCFMHFTIFNVSTNCSKSNYLT